MQQVSIRPGKTEKILTKFSILFKTAICTKNSTFFWKNSPRFMKTGEKLCKTTKKLSNL